MYMGRISAALILLTSFILVSESVNVFEDDILSKSSVNSNVISSEKIVDKKNATCESPNTTSIKNNDTSRNNCCNSSQFCMNKENLVETMMNGRNICIVNTCPAIFYDKQIAYDCETTNKTESLMDFRLSLPVTSTTTNITYKNVFCAYCNGERHYVFWNTRLRCEMKFNSMSDSDRCPKFNREFILSNLKKVENHDEALISNVNNTIFNCHIYGSPPKDLRARRHHVREGRKYENCTSRESFSVDFHDQRLPRFIYYNITDSYMVDGKIFSQFSPFSRNSSVLQKNSCFSITDGEYCQCTYLGSSQHFTFVNNDTTTIFVNTSDLKGQFGVSEWCNVFDKDVVFVCITVAKDNEYCVISKILLLLKAFSIIFFLVLLAAIGTNEEKRRSLPNKIIFSYSITVLILYIVNYVSFWSPWCKVFGPLLHYLQLSRHTWLAIIAYDFWRMIYYSSNLLIKEMKKPHVKRFLIYCFICWISPLSILSVAVFFEFTINGDIPCELRPAYSKFMFCQMTHQKAINYFRMYPVFTTSFIVIIAFFHSSYYVIFIFREHSKCINSMNRKNNLKILMKLAWTMGLAFIITLFSVFFDSPFIKFVFKIFDQSQGIILYLIHGYNRNVGKNINFFENTLSRNKSTMFLTCTDFNPAKLEKCSTTSRGTLLCVEGHSWQISYV